MNIECIDQPASENMPNIEYQHSVRKIVTVLLINAALLLVTIYLLTNYIDNNLNLYMIMATLFWGGFSLVLIKRAKSARCSCCQSDLFDLLAAAETSSLKVRYCPVCGDELA